MSLLVKLEHNLGRFAVPHLTLLLIVCQAAAYVVAQAHDRPDNPVHVAERIELVADKVLEGEVWRLITFLIVPPFGNIIIALFFWYMFCLMGTALEVRWGSFRYNVYLLIGYVAAIGVTFLFPDAPASNAYLMSTVFLAFAALYPDFEIYIFFLLPVKIKWLALIAWIGLGYKLIFGEGLDRVLVLASVSNYLVFFGKDILERAASGRRRMAMQAARFGVREKPYFHRCTVCGITDRSHPDMEFRYCSTCAGDLGYCMDHLRNHEHVTAPGPVPEK
jgi:hypothetical protein